MNGSMIPNDLPEPGVPNTIVPRNGVHGIYVSCFISDGVIRKLGGLFPDCSHCLSKSRYGVMLFSVSVCMV